jgi:hypothetical protein
MKKPLETVAFPRVYAWPEYPVGECDLLAKRLEFSPVFLFVVRRVVRLRWILEQDGLG